MARKITIQIAGGYPSLGKLEGRFHAPAYAVTQTLAINHDLLIDGDGDVAYRNTWNVTHMPTGWAVLRSLPSKGVATAAAELLAAAGLDGITTSDPRAASAAFVRGQLAKWKRWIADTALDKGHAAGLSPAQLEATIRREIRHGARGSGRPSPRRAETRPQPKPAPRRAESRSQSKQKSRVIDLPALARRMRGNPEDLMRAKQRCLP